MKNPIKTSFLVLLLPLLTNITGCSTYVRVKAYRVPKLAPAKESHILVSTSKDNEFGEAQRSEVVSLIEKKLTQENLLSLALISSKEGHKGEVSNGLAEIQLGKTLIQCSSNGSIETAEDGKETRKGTATCHVTQTLKLTQKKEVQVTEIKNSSYQSNEIVLPRKPGKKSLRPIFSALLDIKTEREKAIEKQDEGLILLAKADLQKGMADMIITRIIPNSYTIKQKFDDSEDFEGVEKQIENGNYAEAIKLLLNYPASGPRNYNLALLYDSLHRRDELLKTIKWLEANSRKELHLNYIASWKAREKEKEALQ